MQQEEQIAVSNHQKNIIASMIVALGFIVSASILAYFPGASRAQSRAVDARTLVNNPIYTNADGKC